jgi:hypothetical protein
MPGALLGNSLDFYCQGLFVGLLLRSAIMVATDGLYIFSGLFFCHLFS